MVTIPGYQVNEELYNGSRTLVYRGYRETDSLRVVIKLLKNPYPSFSELVQFRNQYTIAKNLNSPLIIQTYSLEPYQNGYALVMEDFGGISLKEWVTGESLRNLTEFLQIAIALCNTLDILYHQRIIHKDIKPANILINPETKQVKLIDFSIASLLPRETQILINPNVLEGTLAYISPEQTGRMNRGIDYRTDFYSLGVTFYELLTGELPFESNDAMELVHCHIAKLPPNMNKPHPHKAPSPYQGEGWGEVDFLIPKVLCDIVMKLMAKNAESRYQSALGIKFDLENCLTQLQETGEIKSFPIGRRDVCDRFIIPDKLYGRETEVSTLLQAFERVSLGGTEMMLVAGFSGIGKTFVVNEIHKPIVRQRGYFIKGTFDQFQRNIPFSGFVQAFRDLMGQLLTENDAKIQQFKTNILAAVGENGQVIIEVIPELSRIIGQQPPATELSGTAAQNRFNLLFQKFTQVFTSAEHPLVMFLDDLQWTDSASLNLIQLLMADTKHLFLIGAYRDNEVNPAHPLMLTLNDIQKTAATINTITLAPLSQGQVNHLVADTLKCSENLALPLSVLIYQKTRGNPFFATQFLKVLHQDGLIEFNLELGCWQCDIAQVNQQAVTDDVIKFMVLQLQRLPESTQKVLKLAACIGSQFDLSTLAIVSESSEIETAASLWKALQEGLILPTSEGYKFYQDSSLEKSDQITKNIDAQVASFRVREKTAIYKFLHARVQQAASYLIPEEEKQLTHLKIGQLLLENTSEAQQTERIFEIVGQLNCGVALITQPTKRQQLAQLNLNAGRKAKEAIAYGAALEYFNQGIQLVISDGWENAHELTLNLYQAAAEAAFLNNEFEQMDLLIQVVIKEANNLLDKVKVYEIKLQSYQVQGQMLKAIEIGCKTLQQLGILLSESVTSADIHQAIENTLSLLGERQIESLIDLPLMTNPQALVALKIMISLTPSVHQAAPHLFPIIACEQVNLSLKYGNAPLSAPGYADFAIVLNAVLDQLEKGYQFGQLALRIVDKFEAKSVQSMTNFKVAAFNQFNKLPVRDVINLLKESYTFGLEVGDFVHIIGATFFRLFYTYLISGERLEILLKEIKMYELNFASSQSFSIRFSILRRAIEILTQSSTNSDFLIDEYWDEEKLVPALLQENDEFTLHEFYLIKLIFSYSFDDALAAVNNADKGERHLKGGAGMLSVSVFYYYDSLARLSLYSQVEPSEQTKLLLRVDENQKHLKVRATVAPMNFQHKFDLVEAERHWVLGQRFEAIDLYDRAIAGAKANGYVQEEALSNELAAKFYLDWGKEKVAVAYMQEAYYCYARWGAKAKVEDLEKRYPQLLQPILQQRQLNFNALETIAFRGTSSSTRTNTTGSTSISDVLDFTSLLKAAQAISSSLELDALIASLTRIILENSGAKKAALILPQEDIWQVRAITFIQHGEIQTILGTQSLDNCQDIPVNIIHYVKNTKQTVVIDNGKTDIPGLIGEYMHSSQPQSVLCTPIINQGHLVGILYLENQLTQGVFTSDRLSVINFLCTQAAISLENAQLYNHLQEREKFLSSIYEGVGCLVFVTDVRDNVRFEYTGWSKSCELGVGILASKVLGKTPQELHGDEGAVIYQNYLRCLQLGVPITYEECLTFNDQKSWWLTTLSPLKDEMGKVYRLVGTTINISDRKQAESALIEKSQALGTALEDLQQAQLQIVQSEKMSALGNLVAGVAHEMNNPLGFISASLKQAKPTVADIVEHLKLYQQSLQNPSDEILAHAEEIDLDYSLEDLPKAIDSMVMACDRLKNISTSLRTFSRADKDYKVPFNIHEGIDSTILILKHRLKANEQRPAIEVITNYGNLPKIECFPGQLNQVFMNILANAIDALDESNMGRSFEEIKTNPNRVIIKTSLENEGVKIAIADNGKGMNEEIKQKIFDHLFTTKGVGKGTGLGLAIARQIVEETHSGKLSFNSVLGEGTKFIIEIPL
ncbi:AAA family ATPase [Nostoc sp.]|uniref:AAA family ATPase n=1 Tax=Nostoc sp. TaxID=1180 RepID=UPI002FF76DA9